MAEVDGIGSNCQDKAWLAQKPLNRFTKFGVGDYFADITPRSKIQNNRPTGGVPMYE